MRPDRLDEPVTLTIFLITSSPLLLVLLAALVRSSPRGDPAFLSRAGSVRRPLRSRQSPDVVRFQSNRGQAFEDLRHLPKVLQRHLLRVPEAFR